MRPADLDPDWIRKCRDAFDAWDGAGDRLFLLLREELPDAMFEVWLSGCWMNRELRARGADEELVRRLGFVHGQRCVGRDPWSAARAVLDEFIRGLGATPGLELADDLLAGRPPRLERLPGQS